MNDLESPEESVQLNCCPDDEEIRLKQNSTGTFSQAFELYQQFSRAPSNETSDAFYRCFREAVIKIARKHLLPSQPKTYVATQLVNDSFLKLAKAVQDGRTFDSALDIQKFALRIVRTTFLDYARSKSRQRKWLDPRAIDELHAMDDNARAALMDAEALICLDAAIQKLKTIDPRATLVAELFFYGVQDHDAIALQLKISVKTVRRDLLKLGARLVLD